MIANRAKRRAAKSISRMRSRPEVRTLARKYDAWSQSPAGIETTMVLAFGALASAAGHVTAEQHEKVLAALSQRTGLPLSDLRLMAEVQRELVGRM